MRVTSRAPLNALLAAVVVSGVGDLLFDIYVAWSVAQAQGTVMAAAAVLGASILFRALLSLVLGGIIDRFPKRLVLLGSNVGSIGILLILLGTLNASLRLVWPAVVLVLLNDVFNEMFRSAYVVTGSLLADETQFIRFQARAAIALRIVGTAGMVGAGALIALLPGSLVVVVDIGTFVVSAALCTSVRVGRAGHYGSFFDFREFYSDLRFALREVSRDSLLKQFVVLMLVLNLAYGFVPQMLPLVIANDRSSALDLGLLRAGLALGEIFGLIVVERVGRHVSSLFRISMLGCGLSVFAATLGFPVWLAIGMLALYGAFDSLSQPLFSYTVTQIEPSIRGRILGGINGLILLSPTLGIFLGSQLAARASWLAGAFVATIFFSGFLIVSVSKTLGKISPATAETVAG